ncbi:MAG: zinc-binding dehydrogenase [Pirellulaceae bacterium]|nr:zinc-binding dehydrogenase [Planctomycetales bacterium]
MKGLQVVARGRAEYIDMPQPRVLDGHVLVRPRYLSLCGSDIQMLHYARDRQYPFPPGTTGHEMVGFVEDIAVGTVDTDGHALERGDRVLALAPTHQAMCQLFLAPCHHVLKLPNDVPMLHLLQGQQYGTVIYACQRLRDVIAKSVAIIGQGSAGLWFAFQVRRMGARRVVVLDLDERRLLLSRHFGATDLVQNVDVDVLQAVCDANGGELPDIVIEAAGEIESINLAPRLVKKFGQVLYFGYPRSQEFTFNYDELFHKCCHATTIVGAAEESRQVSTRIAINTIASGAIDVSPMLTHTFPFREVHDAYEAHRTHADGAVKIVVEME